MIYEHTNNKKKMKHTDTLAPTNSANHNETPTALKFDGISTSIFFMFLDPKPIYLSYKAIATNTKMILGIHVASVGGRFPFVEKIVENLSVKINKAAVIKPMAK